VTNPKGRNTRKILTAVGMVLVSAIAFMFFGMFIDIQIILEYNYTPIPFTFILPFVGALVGLWLALRTVRPLSSKWVRS
jgi:lipopolysaccharide export LptBFGC system permease protein LptF